MSTILLFVALSLHRMASSLLFNPKINQFLVDYALAIACFVCIAVSYIPGARTKRKRRRTTRSHPPTNPTRPPARPETPPCLGHLVYVERIDLPDVEGFSAVPTLTLANGKPRHWTTNLGTASGTCVGCAAVAAVPIVIFFFFDQNVSSLLCQTSDMKLKKGSYFHSSFMCMGVFDSAYSLDHTTPLSIAPTADGSRTPPAINTPRPPTHRLPPATRHPPPLLFIVFGPWFGMPFVTGSLPHSPQLVNALTTDHGRGEDLKTRFSVSEV